MPMHLGFIKACRSSLETSTRRPTASRAREVAQVQAVQVAPGVQMNTAWGEAGWPGAARTRPDHSQDSTWKPAEAGPRTVYSSEAAPMWGVEKARQVKMTGSHFHQEWKRRPITRSCIQKSKILNSSRRNSIAKLLSYGEFKKYRHIQLYFGGHSTFSYTNFA